MVCQCLLRSTTTPQAQRTAKRLHRSLRRTQGYALDMLRHSVFKAQHVSTSAANPQATDKAAGPYRAVLNPCTQAAFKRVRKVSAQHALLPPQLPFVLCTFAVPNLNCRLPSSRPCGQAVDSMGIILTRPFNQRICRLGRHSSLITVSNLLRCLHFIIKKRY